MNNVFFIIIVSVYALIEGYTAIRLAQKKKASYCRHTITGTVLLLSYILADYLFKLSVPKYTLILVMLALLIHTVFGFMFDCYLKSKLFDRYLHAFGAFSFALFLYAIIEAIWNPITVPTVYSSLFVATLGISSGVIFEIIEFIEDSLSKTRNQKGLTDTDWDLIADMTGSAIAGIFAFFKL